MKKQKLTDDEITEIVLTESRKIQKIVNEDLLSKFAKLHNIDEKYNFFDAKQEVVARRSYWPGPKKKYILHLINEEGVKVDETQTKGLIVRRSDYPSLTKLRIKEVLELLVMHDKVSFTKIRKLIDETRGELYDLILKGDKTIARPSSFTKDLKEYKVRPMHIKGMLLWNKLEYNYFTPGSRGYLFRINGIDRYKAPDEIVDKLNLYSNENNIVIPIEETTLPAYYDIDVKSMIAFAWDDRINELIQPIQSSINPEVSNKEAMTW